MKSDAKLHIAALPLLILCCLASYSSAQAPASTANPAHANNPPASNSFDASAPAALQAMRSQAEAMKVGGVAVLAYFEGDTIQSWTSKMLVVGHVKDEPTETKKGSNLLAIAYAKAAEMADTLKDSGSQTRPPMTGEFGWQGGVIVRVQGGYLIAAFSGGQSADDVAISHTGLAALQQHMQLTSR